MLRHGSDRWQLILFGLVTVLLGLYLWNGLGPRFGLGQAKGRMSRAAAVTSCGLLALIVLAEILLSSKS